MAKPSTLSQLDKTIASTKYILKRRKEKVDEMSRRLDLNENQKIFIGQEHELIKNTQILIDHCKIDLNKQLGKLPPQALDLEESVLGAIILESPSLAKVESFLKPDHFYSTQHHEIYKVCLKLRGESEPIDMRTVVIELRRIGMMEVVGGAHKVAELASKVSSSSNIEYHARVLVEMAIKRQLIVMAGKLLMDGYEDQTDCFELLDYAEEQVKELSAWKKK